MTDGVSPQSFIFIRPQFFPLISSLYAVGIQLSEYSTSYTLPEYVFPLDEQEIVKLNEEITAYG